MRRCLAALLLTVCCTLLQAQSGNAEQKIRKTDVNEYVDVLNIEMIARVQQKGQPVRGLKKEDFILKANGRKVEINGFREVRRRIRRAPEEAAGPNPAPAAPPGRLFVLCFWLWDRNAAYAQTLDLFFRTIFQPGDRLILAHTRGVAEINSADEVGAVRARFETELKGNLDRDNQARSQIFTQVDEAISDYLNRPPNMPESVARAILQGRVQAIWLEFRMRFLQVDARSLTGLADSLKSVDREKWALVFVQEELFPEFPDGGPIPAIRNRLEWMTRSMRDYETAFSEKIRSSFIAADATVSLIRLSSRGLEDMGRSPYYRNQTIFSSREESFRQISRVTGGVALDAGDLPRALDQAADKEDVSYAISFVPTDGKWKKRVQLTCRDRSFDIFASRRSDAGDPREMAIIAARVDGSTLTFRLRGYARLFEDGRLQGRVLVCVRANGGGLRDAETSREFTLADAQAQIPVSLRLPRGRLSLEIRALDRISGREASSRVTVRNR